MPEPDTTDDNAGFIEVLDKAKTQEEQIKQATKAAAELAAGGTVEADSGLSTGALIGIIIGGVAVIAIVTTVIIFCKKKKNRAKTEDGIVTSQTKVQPLPQATQVTDMNENQFTQSDLGGRSEGSPKRKKLRKKDQPTDDENASGAGNGIISQSSQQDLGLNSPGKHNSAIMSGLDRGSRNKDTLRTIDNSGTGVTTGLGNFPPVNQSAMNNDSSKYGLGQFINDYAGKNPSESGSGVNTGALYSTPAHGL